MSLIQYVRNQCSKCGNKFTLCSEDFCNTCKNLGVQCKHKKLCLRCYKDENGLTKIRNPIADRIFFSALTAMVLVSYYAIGVKIF